MRSFALICFLLLASACVFVARAEEETPAVADASKEENTPEVAADEEQTEEKQADEEDTEADEEDTEADEEETEDDEENEDEETEEDEEETTDVADDEPEKRGWKCRNYRKGKLYCRACQCRRVCRPRYCIRRVCKRVRCGFRRVCRKVYRTIRYKFYHPKYPGYGPRWVWKTKRVARIVCRNVPKFCTRCRNIRYRCGSICRNKCAYNKCRPAYRG